MKAVHIKSRSIFDVVHLPSNSLLLSNFTTNALHNVYMYYTILVHVSAIYFAYLQEATSLIYAYSADGNLS
jgi:hypothetical protein